MTAKGPAGARTPYSAQAYPTKTIMFAEGALVNRKYRILAELGQGALGLSYKALVLGSNTVCVIKVLDDSLVPSLIPRELVEQAVVKSNELRHPASLRWQAVEFGGGGETILVRDFVEGPSLKSTLVDGTPFSVPRATHVVRQIALALDAAQRMKMVHGDLRPANILLCNSEGGEKVRILDFGMARLRENFTCSLHRLTLKDPGPMMGDPRYLSPEQAAGLRCDSLESRSDIYSLGIIFWQLLTGHLPSPEPPLESLLWHVMGTPPGLRECYPELKIPEDLDQLIRQMLAKPREKRIESARALSQRLEIFEGLNSRVRAKAIEAPSFALLSDKNRPRPPARSMEPSAPKGKPPETESPKMSPPPVTPAATLPVGAVEIAVAPFQPGAVSALRSPQPQSRSSRGWMIAASILIALAGLGTASYQFRSRIPWAAAGKVNPARLQSWGQGLEASLHSSAQKIEAGLHSWSQKVQQQLSARHTTLASAPAQTATSAATSATSPPDVTPPANIPVGTPAPPAQNATLVHSPATATASPATHEDESGGAVAELNKNLAPPIESREHRATDESRPPEESKPPAAPTARHPYSEQPPSAPGKLATPAPLDSASLAKTIRMEMKNGDALFELGQYDQAIRDYRMALALDPANKVLVDRIARAKKAQAAEAEFLNQ